MNAQNKIKDQVESTMNAFEQDVPPKMDPWFYDRLTNRIKQDASSQGQDNRSWYHTILKPGMLTALVAVNILMMVWMSLPTESVSGGQNYIENLSTEYGLNYTDTYLLSDVGE